MAPYIVVTGCPGEETAQFHICAEARVLLDSKSLRDAVVDLITAFYIFNLQYPKGT